MLSPLAKTPTRLILPAATQLLFDSRQTAAAVISGSSVIDFSGNGNNATLKGSNCVQFNGTTQYISVPSLIGTETVLSHGGTATPSIAAGRINFTAGTAWDIVLSNGSHYLLAEGLGPNCYDASNNYAHGLYVNSPTFTTQDAYHGNIIRGHQVGTQYITYPEDFSNAAWIVFSPNTKTPNTTDIQAPDGSNTAVKFVVASNSANRSFGGSFSVGTSVINRTFTFSYWLYIPSSINCQFFKTYIYSSGEINTASATNMAGIAKDTWVRVYHSYKFTVSTATIISVQFNGNFPTTLGTYYIWHPMLEETTTPSSYQYVNGTKNVGAKVPATTAGKTPSPLGGDVSNPATNGHNGAESKINFNLAGLPTAWGYGDSLPSGMTADISGAYRNMRYTQ